MMQAPKLPETQPESEDELLDQVAREFIRGVKGDDHKGMMDAMRALMSSMRAEDEMQDEEMSK